MEAAGLRSIREERIKVTYGMAGLRSPKSEKLGAGSVSQCLVAGAVWVSTGWSVWPLTRINGWSAGQLENLISKAEADIRNRRYHSYCYM